MSRVRHGNEVRNMNTKEIGAKIAALRKKQGITQEALAEQVGVSAQAVSKWENGWNLSLFIARGFSTRTICSPKSRLLHLSTALKTR